MKDTFITLTAHPNAKHARVEYDLLDELHVYVNEPPLEGKANKAIIQALARHLKLRPNQINIVSGIKSKHKTFRILDRSS